MDLLEALLRAESTELTRLAHAATAGFMATLETGLASLPVDPAADRVRAVVAHWKQVTAQAQLPRLEDFIATPPSGPPISEMHFPKPEPWEELRDSWSCSREWKEWLGSPGLPKEDLPRRLWLLTHRLPSVTAHDWQQSWLTTSRTHQQVEGSVVAGPTELLLCPSLPHGPPSVRSAPTGKLDPQLGPTSPGGLAARMASVTTTIL